MADPIRITDQTMPSIAEKLKLACEAKDDYQVVIQKFDASVKARQRALAQCWYREIAEHQGDTLGEAEAFCKLHWGLRIRCENDPDLRNMVNRMLHGYNYEQKLKYIEIYPEWFPILRAKNGLDQHQTARYLTDMQRGMAEQGCFLSSKNDDSLLSYPEYIK